MKLLNESQSVHSTDPEDSSSLLAYRKLRRRVRVIAAALIVLGLVAAAGWRGPDSNQVKELEPAKAEPRPITSMDEAFQTFQRFAVNALVTPLIDDDMAPPRWTLHAMDWICDGRGAVAIDGKRPVHGEPIPIGNFRVGWTLQRCPPLQGAEILVEGDITLAVFNSGTDLRADISAANLLIETFANGRRAFASAWTSRAIAP